MRYGTRSMVLSINLLLMFQTTRWSLGSAASTSWALIVKAHERPEVPLSCGVASGRPVRPAHRSSRRERLELGATSIIQRAVYNVTCLTYNEAMSETSHVMTVSRNGQVSIPAETRARWNTRQVLVVDLGDRVVMRPVGAEPVGELRGKYAKQGPTTVRARRESRREDTERSARR